MVTHLWQFMGQNSKIWGVKKIRQRFWKTEPLYSKPRQTPWGCRTPWKWYHHIASIPAHLKPQATLTPRCSFIEKTLTFWGPLILAKVLERPWSCQKLTYVKIDLDGALGDVSSCLETKFDKKMSMGSVPNWPKEIADHDPIRWFKCKLKPSKKLTLNGPRNGQSVTYSKMQTKVCRGPWGAPMDWCLMKSVNAEYPLSCRKCVEKPPKSGTFGFEALPEPPSVSHCPENGTTI